jgi:cellulose synthase/poly-beta-1,6-N-acetylglucosamine synthase-like glycosyltransferase
MERFRGNPQVKIIRKENGGKHTALNAGIAATDAEIVGCLDADSYVEPDALGEILPSFDHENVGATTAAMSVYQPKTLMQHMQNVEYIFGIALRHALCSINAIYVTPGPFSLYRRDVVLKVGGFHFGHQTEDMEMALRLQRAGYVIENAPRARVYTNAPATAGKLIRQRVRWTTGFLRNMRYEYRDMVLNHRYGALGLLVLPVAILAIVGGLALFILAIFLFAKSVTDSYLLHQGVPYTFSFSFPTSFDWFYIPASTYLVLALVTLLIMVGTIIIGKRVSGTRGPIGRGLLSYMILYGLIAPFWLMRATADVVIGTKRSWK